jgi:hypothetical protein
MSDQPFNRKRNSLATEICEDIIDLLEKEGRIPYFDVDYHKRPTAEVDRNLDTFRAMTDLVEAYLVEKVKEYK